MTWGGWPRFSRDTAERGAFSASVLDATTLVLSLVVVIFAVVTQLLAANGAISLSTTQQLTMWLVVLGLIVLLSIAYMACRVYVSANTAPPGAVKPEVPAGVRTNGGRRGNPGAPDSASTGVQTDGNGRTEQADEADQVRAALAAAEEQLKKARARAAEAEQEAKSARARAAEAEQAAKYTRARAEHAKQEAKARLVDEVASKVANWQRD